MKKGFSAASRLVLSLGASLVLAQHEPPETIKPSPIGPHLAVPLTCRELEVLDLVCLGLANKAIALRLSISEGTVKNHLKNIYRKLSATNRTEAAMLHRHGF
jgi:DNA-binding NarL/FixJ family response regulator